MATAAAASVTMEDLRGADLATGGAMLRGRATADSMRIWSG
jgi:hypothetical protein